MSMFGFFKKKSDPLAVSKETTYRSHNFSGRLFNELESASKDENIIFSPFSITCAMAILYGGASGETRREFEELFGFSGVEEVASEYRNLINYTLGIGDSKAVSLANGLWIDRSLESGIEDDFVNRAVESFSSSIYPADFKSPALPSEVNAWVSEITRGRITSLVDSLSGASSLIANALYFSGKWSTAFDRRLTKDDQFDTISNGVVPCQMMISKDFRAYYETENSQVAFLKYLTGAQPTSMAICLPKPGKSIQDSLKDLERIHLLRDEAKPKELKLSVPKFKIEFKTDLNKAFQNLGMVKAFNEKKAQFDQFCPGFFIGKVIHKATLEFDEEGSVAAAATAVMMYAGAAPPAPPTEPIVMRVDRPFLLAIIDEKNSSTLFSGAVMKPNWQD